MVTTCQNGMCLSKHPAFETHTHRCCTIMPRETWLIMQGNAACHMFVWRQLTDLICWAPVTCCRTFSSSFSMRAAQWFILQEEEKRKEDTFSVCVPQHYLNKSSHKAWILCHCIWVNEWVSVSVRLGQWVCPHLCIACVLLASCQHSSLPISGFLSERILVLSLLMSKLLISTSFARHILHISIWLVLAGLAATVPVLPQLWISSFVIKLLQSDRSAP